MSLDCPTCAGRGVIEGTEQMCCGNVTKNGECRSHCSVEVQTQGSCETCGGHGKLFEVQDLKKQEDL